ncbi:hypothetical protein AB0F91_01760 [Amycolatopsis sp. NPDC023774]|uniref:hypothetical protein n=1 Tax=Amycolatopsis sp. NPDC023774 TaxID=3155015 RepID=UPI0033D53CA9
MSLVEAASSSAPGVKGSVGLPQLSSSSADYVPLEEWYIENLERAGNTALLSQAACLARNPAAPVARRRPRSGDGLRWAADVVNLDPALLAVLRWAATDAAAEGVEIFVNGGWRSPEYQEWLLADAVARYGVCG